MRLVITYFLTAYTTAAVLSVGSIGSGIAAAQSVAAPELTARTIAPGTELAEATRLANTGHPIEALAILDKLAVAQPATAGIERVRGIAYYNGGQLQEADAAFTKAILADSHDEEATQMRGLTLFRLGRPADAIPFLEQTSNKAQQSKADPSYVLALCYMDTRRYDDARQAFARQYGFAPESAPAYLVSARMLFRREFAPVAQRFALKAAELDPQLPLVNELLGEIALAGNHLEDAASYFEKERARNPLEASVYDRLGDTYSRSARYADARKVLQQAVLLEPNSTGPYILLGKVSLKENDPLASIAYLQRAEQMDSSNYMTHNLLAQAYRAVGRSADATRELQLTEQTQHTDTTHTPATQ